MKKLLSIAAIAALLTTGTMAVNNQISVTGSVLAGAQVSMNGAPIGSLVGGQFTFEGGAVAFPSLTLGIDSVDTQSIYVKTNSITGVTMALADTVNGGNLLHTNGVDTVPTTYTLLGGAVTIGGAPITLVTTINDGTIPVGNIETTAHTAPAQLSGDYSTVLAVTIAQI